MTACRRLTSALGLVLLATWPLQAAVVLDWDFSSGPQGWRDEAGSAPERGAEGLLWPGSAAGISLRSPALTLPTEAFQALELTARAEGPGLAQVLWYGVGFGRAQASWNGPLPLEVPADGRSHQLRLLPFWQNVRTIEALRLVAPTGTRLRLTRLQITGPSVAPADQPLWDLSKPLVAGQWLSLAGGATLRPAAGGLNVVLQDPAATLVSPPLDTPTYLYEWLAAEVSSFGLTSLRPAAATSGQRGLHGDSLHAREGRHFYNVRFGGERGWVGAARGLALELAGAPGASGQVHHLGLYPLPQGPADLETLYAGPVEGQVRAGQTFRLAWVVQNSGGQEATDVRLWLDPGEATIVRAPQTDRFARLDHGVPQVLIWELQARGAAQVALQAEYDGRQLRETLTVPVGPVLPALPWSRVAAPRVAESNEGPVLAALYRRPEPPGLGPAALPRRLYERPYLGDYDPTPEVMDWQIKWARESGVGAFIFDVGSNEDTAERATLDAFLAATFSRQMQFCLRWTARTPTVAEGQELFGRALAPLLAQPNYLRLGGRPAVLVAYPLVGSAEGLGLSDLRELAGNTGLTFVACLPAATVTGDLLRQAGYSACTDLHTDPMLADGDSLAESWENAGQRQVPQALSLQPAWRETLTPARFGTLLRIARLRAQRPDSGALPLVILGDWNGPYGVEPRRPYGFAYLDTVAGALALSPPTRLLPEEVGLGPYDRPLPTPPDQWWFDTKDSWTSAMGMSVLRLTHGQLTARTDTDSPALFGGDTMLDTRQYDTVVIGLAASAGAQGRLWWRTSLRKFTLEDSLPFTLIADGAVHEYRLPVGAQAGWRGYLEGLRLDPTDAVGASIALDYVRVLPRE